MNSKSKQHPIGSPQWNDQMFGRHPTPYSGIAGWIERQRVQSIIKQIHQNGQAADFSLLEVGCEAGHLLAAIAKAFPQARLTGLDISEKALSQAKKQLAGTPTNFIQGDITQPFSTNAAYNFILCSETLEHIPNYEAAIQNLALAGNNQTIFIITVPLESLKNRVKKLLNKLKIFDLLFPGIEEGMSEWHVNDFSKNAFLTLLSPHFEIKGYWQIWGLHQVAVCRRSESIKL